MSFDTIIDTIKKILDIAIVWVLIYTLLKNVKSNVKLSLLFKGILFIIIIKVIADWLGLVTVGLLLEYVIEWGPLALIIIFQPEIRSILEQIGKTQLLGRHKVLSVDERERLVYEIITAVDNMRKAKIGALIVIERDVSLIDYINKATNLYAEITSELLVSIFFPNNPLHDGGVIIQGDKISCAGAVFPISLNTRINKRLGTRHRAALGISEESDSIAIVVSEETGKISIAISGVLNYNLSIDDVRMMLVEELKPKHEILLDDEFEDSEEGVNNENN